MAFILAACADTSPDYDPITQIGNAKRAVMGWFGDEEPAPPVVIPPPAEGRPIPNLGTVPPPPLVTTGERQQRQKELEALQADRTAAAKADAALRARTASAETAPTQSPAPPVPVASAPLAAPASTAGSSAPAPAAPPNASAKTPPGQPEAPSISTATASAPQTPAIAMVGAPPPANSLPESLLSSTPVGAGPAPVIELPTLPPALARKAAVVAGLLTTSEPHGVVSFAAGATELTAVDRNTLDAAAASAVENNGRVRLVPAQVDEAAAPNLAARRTKALREALTGTGLPAERITIGELGGQRIDVYNVYVDY